MYTYMYTFAYTCTFVYMYAYACAYTHVYILVQSCICMQTLVHILIHIYIYKYTLLHIFIYVCTRLSGNSNAAPLCKYIHVDIYMCVYLHLLHTTLPSYSNAAPKCTVKQIVNIVKCEIMALYNTAYLRIYRCIHTHPLIHLFHIYIHFTYIFIHVSFEFHKQVGSKIYLSLENLHVHTHIYTDTKIHIHTNTNTWSHTIECHDVAF